MLLHGHLLRQHYEEQCCSKSSARITNFDGHSRFGTPTDDRGRYRSRRHQCWRKEALVAEWVQEVLQGRVLQEALKQGPVLEQ